MIFNVDFTLKNLPLTHQIISEPFAFKRRRDVYIQDLLGVQNYIQEVKIVKEFF